MPPLITADEYLVGNLIPLATPAWRIDDLTPLGQAPMLRGDNEPMPGAAGQRGFDKVPDQLETVVFMFVNGALNDDGTPTANARQGHRDHARYLYENLGKGTLVSGVWHQFDASTRSATVQFEGPFGGRRIGPYVYRYSLGVIIPAGFWTVDP